MVNSKSRKGGVAEMKARTRITELGFPVSIPILDEPYDMIVDTGNSLHKIQVKSGYTEPEGSNRTTIRVSFLRHSYEAGGSVDRNEYTEDEIDAYVIYNPVDDELYWLWFSEAPKTGARRVRETWKKDLVKHKLE